MIDLTASFEGAKNELMNQSKGEIINLNSSEIFEQSKHGSSVTLNYRIENYKPTNEEWDATRHAYYSLQTANINTAEAKALFKEYIIAACPKHQTKPFQIN